MKTQEEMPMEAPLEETPAPEVEASQVAPPEETPVPSPQEPPSVETPEAPPEPEGEAAPQQQGSSALPGMIQRFFPSQDVSTPQGQIEGAERLLSALIPIHDKLYDVAQTSPEAAATLNDLLETGSLVKAIARNYDPEELEALMQEINDEAYEEDRSQFSQKNAQRKERETKLKGNLELSLSEIAAYMEEKKDWDEQRASDFADFVRTHYENGWDGLIGKKDLQMLEKGFRYDEEVENARTEGEIAGRNQQITQGKKTKKDLESLLPELSASAQTPEASPKESDAFLGGLKSIANKKPILS